MAVMGSMACEASIQQRTGINGQMTEILALYKKDYLKSLTGSEVFIQLLCWGLCAWYKF